MRFRIPIFGWSGRIDLNNSLRPVISVLDPDNSGHTDLRGGHSPWLTGDRQAVRHDLPQNVKCDALILDGGITGSLVAERLTRGGLDVVIIDREIPGTAASTSMLLWEIDRPLRELAEIYDLERASRAYRSSLRAVSGLQTLVRDLGISCEMRAKDSLYLAAGGTAKDLIEEHKLRMRVGLPGDFHVRSAAGADMPMTRRFAPGAVIRLSNVMEQRSFLFRAYGSDNRM